MTVIKLMETDLRDDEMRYELLNSHEHPFSKRDYKTMMNSGMFYNNPNDYYDSEYGDESWLLWGDKATVSGYFLNEQAVQKVRELGYELEINTRAERQRKAKLKRLRNSLVVKIEAFIKERGVKPDAWVSPEGEEIETPHTRGTNLRIYGGGSWFVVGNDYIWYVRNNGADGDFWGANNVRTGGAGAMGWKVSYDEYIEEKIRMTTKPISELTEDDLQFDEGKIDLENEDDSESEEPTDEYVANMREEGKTYNQIKEETGFSRGKIYRILKKKGLVDSRS